MSENCVVIPIYKNSPSAMEDISFIQGVNVLKKHDFVIVTHKNLDISFYTTKMKLANIHFKIEYFDPKYFENITGYNFLMLSKDFYTRFINYKSILIYQLDCFVFKDELDYWANTDFDYIGSPWFTHYMSHASDRPFWYNGNGGFSIRKVSKFLQILNRRLPLKKMDQIKLEIESMGYPKVYSFFIQWLMWFGFKNNTSKYLKFLGYDFQNIDLALYDGVKRTNEDTIWSNKFKYTRVKMNIPDMEEGLGFSFEQSPEYLYKLNNNTLPFGCHAWWKYDLNFWKPFIESFGYKIPEQ